ncbi:MAG: hypothetical protein ACI4TG_09490, partial [Ruminococcus sp.]
MNSILTIQERMLLQSLGCKDKVQAIAVLSSIKMEVPVRSELFANAVTLENKLKMYMPTPEPHLHGGSTARC